VAASTLISSLSGAVDPNLAKQLIEEAQALEESFLLKRWKYSELDGGRFAEVAARIIYAADSNNTSLTKSVDDCLKYIDNNQVAHNFPEPQTAIHISKVIRAIYKLRSQRGAVHVSPTYTANEIDSRLIIECVRWVLAELLRLFLQIDRQEVAALVRDLARFPQPLIREYENIPLLQDVTFTAEEEVLAHLLESSRGMTTAELISVIPKDPSGVRRAVLKLSNARTRQIVSRSSTWIITDLGTERIEAKVSALKAGSV
jgi:hypothetical protein